MEFTFRAPRLCILPLSFVSIVVLTMSGCKRDPAPNDTPPSECAKGVEAKLESISQFVKAGCYKQSTAEQAWAGESKRDSAIHDLPGSGNSVQLRSYRSPDLQAWVEGGRQGPPPVNSGVVAELYASADAETPSHVLSMVRSESGWLFAEHNLDGKVRGAINEVTCRGCHSFTPHQFHGRGSGDPVSEAVVAAQAEVTIPNNPGIVSPAPVFQRGDQLSTAYADDAPEVQAFLDFYNNHVTGDELPNLSASDVYHFPPQSLDLVHHTASGQQEVCDPTAPGASYPLSCDSSFATSDVCQGCHSSTTEGSRNTRSQPGALPQLAYYSNTANTSEGLVANWSFYGEYAASIMGLASRDPVWQAQIETETNYNSGVDSAVIQDVCFRCHGPMGERQVGLDKDEPFSTDMFYAVIDDNPAGYTSPYASSSHGGADYAKYGALARDGISCEVCHRVQPDFGEIQPSSGDVKLAGQWPGTTYNMFYGPDDPLTSSREQPPGPAFPFTANFEYRLATSANGNASLALAPIIAPDDVWTTNPPGSNTNDTANPMISSGVAVAPGDDLNVASSDEPHYMRESALCGGCHVLAVPKIPTGYAAGVAIPPENPPWYTYPEACDAATQKTFTGDPLTDPCVALSYEQATYFEWVNSAFATTGANFDASKTCQGCHMPMIDATGSTHDAVVAQYEQYNTVQVPSRTFRRHRVLGINLFVHEMYQQFADVLGITTVDATVPNDAGDPTKQGFVTHNLLNAEQSIVDQATAQADGVGPNLPAASLEIISVNSTSKTVTASIKVTNNAGHKFPSGAGFRRAWIQMEVLDDGGNVIWASGQPNSWGALCNGPCNAAGDNLLASEFTTDYKQLQPHYETITSQDQVQIYEVREADDKGVLTSRTLSLFKGVKDNRILPRGYVPQSQCVPGQSLFGLELCNMAEILDPESLVPNSKLASDPYYTDKSKTGADLISYEIPISSMSGTPASIRVELRYQTIPPNYLSARYQVLNDYPTENTQATRRMLYITSHLDMDNLGLQSSGSQAFDVCEDWSMRIDRQSRGGL